MGPGPPWPKTLRCRTNERGVYGVIAAVAHLRAHFRRAHACIQPDFRSFFSFLASHQTSGPPHSPPQNVNPEVLTSHSNNQPYIFNLSRSTTRYHFVISERFLLLVPPFSSLYSLNNQFSATGATYATFLPFSRSAFGSRQVTSHSTLPTHHFFTRLSVTYLVCALKSIIPYTLDFCPLLNFKKLRNLRETSLLFSHEYADTQADHSDLPCLHSSFLPPYVV